jgi:hypothetical protein
MSFGLFGNPFEVDYRHITPEVAGAILEIVRMAWTDIPGHNAINFIEPPEDAMGTQVRALKEEPLPGRM